MPSYYRGAPSTVRRSANNLTHRKQNYMTKKKMTKSEFIAICGEFTIEPSLALECEAVIRALKTGEPDAVRLALACEF